VERLAWDVLFFNHNLSLIFLTTIFNDEKFSFLSRVVRSYCKILQLFNATRRQPYQRAYLRFEHTEIVELEASAYINGLYEDPPLGDGLEEFVEYINNNQFKSLSELLEKVVEQKWESDNFFGVVYFLLPYRHDELYDEEYESREGYLPCHDHLSAPIEPLFCEYVFYKSKGIDVDTLEKQLLSRISEMFKLPYGVDYINQYGDNLGNLHKGCADYLTRLAIALI
jgi:hypothetical protein